MSKMAILQARLSFCSVFSLIVQQSGFLQGVAGMPHYVFVIALGNLFPSKEDNVISAKRTTNFTARFAHTALRPVAPNRPTELFSRYKSNTTLMVVLSFIA